MAPRRLLVTGFGPFPGVVHNPSREIALLLAERGLGRVPGGRSGVEVTAAELPVVFAEVAPAIDEAIAAMPRPPDVLLGLGVWSRGHAFRLERRARAVFDASRVDNAGATGEAIVLGRELATDWDLPKLAASLGKAGFGEVLVSDDAGGYVCERAYLHLLTRAEHLGARAIFLHVPPLEVVGLEHQVAAAAWLARQLFATKADG